MMLPGLCAVQVDAIVVIIGDTCSRPEGEKQGPDRPATPSHRETTSVRGGAASLTQTHCDGNGHRRYATGRCPPLFRRNLDMVFRPVCPECHFSLETSALYLCHDQAYF